MRLLHNCLTERDLRDRRAKLDIGSNLALLAKGEGEWR